LAGHVAYVHNDELVNLMVIDDGGNTRPEKQVILLQEDSQRPTGDYCTWMPYQKGQAAKTEALEAKLAG
jgi:hypothetical protein